MGPKATLATKPRRPRVRPGIVGGVAVMLGTLALAAATWSDDTLAPLAIEIPWSLQATWGSVARACLIAIAVVSLGIALLIAAYALRRKTAPEDAPSRQRPTRTLPR